MKKITKLLMPALMLFAMSVTSCGTIPGMGHGNQDQPSVSQPEPGKPGEDGKPGQDGKPGKDGTSLLTGEGEPGYSQGNVGDSYINTLTWDFYVREEYGWTKKGNIKGDNGQNGNDGQPGEIGPQGPAGEDGQPGKDGTSFRSGNGLPVVAGAIEGDVYLNLETNILYQFVNNSWIEIGKISSNEKFTVKFETYTDEIVIPDQVVDKGGKVTKPYDYLMNRKGYNFKGWTYKGEPWSFIGYSVTEDMTICANWEQLEYKMRFAEYEYTATMHYGDTIYCPTYSKPYHTFLGWYYGDTKIEEGMKYEWDHDITVYPKFKGTFPMEDYIKSIKQSTGHDEMVPSIPTPSFEVNGVNMNGKDISFYATEEQFNSYMEFYKNSAKIELMPKYYLIPQLENYSMISIMHDGSNIRIEVTYYDDIVSTWPTANIDRVLKALNVTKFKASDFDFDMKINFDISLNTSNKEELVFSIAKPVKDIYVDNLTRLGFTQSKFNPNEYEHPDTKLVVKVEYENLCTTFRFSKSLIDKDGVINTFRKLMFDETATFIWPDVELNRAYIYNNSNIYLGIADGSINADIAKAEYEAKLEKYFKHEIGDKNEERFYIDDSNTSFAVWNEYGTLNVNFSSNGRLYQFNNLDNHDANIKKYVTNTFGDVLLPSKYAAYGIANNFNNDSLSFVAAMTEADYNAYLDLLKASGYFQYKDYYYGNGLVMYVKGYESYGYQTFYYQRCSSFTGSMTTKQLQVLLNDKWGTQPELNNVTITANVAGKDYEDYYSIISLTLIGDPQAIVAKLDEMFANTDFKKDILGYENEEYRFEIGSKFTDRVEMVITCKAAQSAA